MATPSGFTDKEWLENHMPTYFLTAPKGVVVGIYTDAREVLSVLKPDLRIDCKKGLTGERYTIVHAERGQ